MATIPKSVAESRLSRQLAGKLTRINQGKVRDTYALPDKSLLLLVATDRVSIFDFVLPAFVASKGHVLTALTVHWLNTILHSVANHLVAFGRNIDQHLPTQLRNSSELQKVALVVRKLEIIPIECIVRGYLTGSGWRSYQKNGSVCDITLPTGLHDGSRLSSPIFTPTTKAETGHDEDLAVSRVISQHGVILATKSITIYRLLANFAKERSIILADTKFEFGQGDDKSLVLADEVGTPDSSRFWDIDEWKTAVIQQKSPTPHDKELVRQWGLTIPNPFEPGKTGLNTLDTENPDHLDFVSKLTVPPEILAQTTSIYLNIFQRLTGTSLTDFTRNVMGVANY